MLLLFSDLSLQFFLAPNLHEMEAFCYN